MPANVESDEAVDAFNQSLLAICAARNNNVELTQETTANKKGLFEYMRASLPANIAERIEWKTNDGGEVKSRDVIALAWIPLSAITLPTKSRIPPQYIYGNKGACVAQFNDLMTDEKVSKKSDEDYTYELTNSSIASALEIAGDLPALYDKIYADFPNAYNRDGGGAFGKLSVVKMAKDMRTPPTAHFTDQQVDYSYPDGLIMPLVYGLKALMKADEHGNLKWTTDPYDFLDGHFGAIVKKYRVIIEAYRADPQKIGKNEGSYDYVVDAFNYELVMLKNAA